jgi:hypothetical protein
MTAFVACGSEDDSTDAAPALSLTSGSAASREASAGNSSVDASTGAVVEEAADDEGESRVPAQGTPVTWEASGPASVGKTSS